MIGCVSDAPENTSPSFVLKRSAIFQRKFFIVIQFVKDRHTYLCFCCELQWNEIKIK